MKLKKSKAFQALHELLYAEGKRKYPNLPESAITTLQKYSSKTPANRLTAQIIDFIRLKGGQAERINTMGRYLKGTKQFTDSVGFRHQIGNDKYIPTIGTKGSADVSAVIQGRPVKIEIKIGSDRQSENQIKYAESVEKAGGIYFIAKDFESFYEYYEYYLTMANM